MDLRDVEKYYSRMLDEDLIRISIEDGKGLRPEVFAIIEAELEKRNLHPNLLKSAVAQNEEFSEDEIENYANLFRKLPCPVCNNTDKPLNGTFTYELYSFVLFTSYQTKIIIACPPCLSKKNNRAILNTTIFGWWAIPWGLLKTPLYIVRNFHYKKQNNSLTANSALVRFVRENIGTIEFVKDDADALQRMISLHESED